MPSFRFSDFKTHHKVLITCFILLMGMAYCVGFAQIFAHAGMNTQHIKDYYRGNENKMIFEKPLKEMLSVTHVHLFSIAFAFFLLGLLFSFTQVRNFYKSFLYIMVALSVVADISMPYLIRYVSSSFACVLYISSSLQATGFFLFMLVPLYEMWLKAGK